jgi:hypothetical protein
MKLLEPPEAAISSLLATLDRCTFEFYNPVQAAVDAWNSAAVECFRTHHSLPTSTPATADEANAWLRAQLQGSGG